MFVNRFIESDQGRRRILPELSPHHFGVQKIDMPRGLRRALNRISRILPGNSFYILITGSHLNPLVADEAVRRARVRTRILGASDDLDNTGTLIPGDPNYEAYRTAHAIEHLAAYDMFARGVNLMPFYMGERQTLGETWLYGIRRFLRPPDVFIGFYFGEGIASSEEEHRSVQNACLEIAREIRL